MVMGRPRKFDPEHALDLAVDVFWSKGYDGTTMSDIAVAMGVAKPSIYAAFGNKEDLFELVLEWYSEGAAGYFRMALVKTEVKLVFEGILYGAADAATDPLHPPGCLAVQAIVSIGGSSRMARSISLRRADNERSLRERLEFAVREGELSQTEDTFGLARYISAVTQGMAVQARAGVRRDHLRELASIVLKTLPRR